jgi:shikimate kinase
MHTPATKQKHLIYLTGFMGCGKSTIGPILANTLGYSFADVDKVIEERVGKSVRDIFREDGEKFFRDIERQVVSELSRRDHQVVSLGGGSVVDPGTFAMIKNSGILVYLYSSPEQLLRRLRHKTDRPVLANSEGANLAPEELRERVMQLFAAREPLYAQAQVIVHTDEKKVGLTVDEIVRRLSQLLK